MDFDGIQDFIKFWTEMGFFNVNMGIFEICGNLCDSSDALCTFGVI